MIEQRINPQHPYALVTLRSGPDDQHPIVRPAALLYDTPDGFAWIEPGYLDPWGAASPALHFVEAAIEETSDGFVFAGAHWQGTIVFLEDLEADPYARPLAWYATELERTGKRWSEEHESLRGQVKREG